MDMNSILSMVKDQVEKTISAEAAIPEEKRDSAVEATTSSVVNTLKNNLGGGGLSSLLGDGLSGIEGKVETAISSALTSKVGLSPAIANTVTTKVVSAVMKLISSGGDGGRSGLDLGSLAGALKNL